MNNTISTFSDFNKYRTIQILYKEQNHPLANNDYNFNYSNLFNKIESIRGNHHPNIYYQTENNILVNNKKNKDKNQNVINNLKQLSVKKKKIFNNNINILQFNNDICSKTPNPNFTGKKIFLSRYPLVNKNKIAENEKNKNNNIKYLLCNDGKDNKTLEINSTILDKCNNHGYLNINNGNLFSTKIEKELNDILNKNKNLKTENNSDNYKSPFNDKSSYISLINNNNESKCKNNNENYITKENKIIKEQKGIYINRNDLYNQYLNSNIVKRKVLFIDKYNNTLSNDNTITLLTDEKDLLLEKYLIRKDDKGNDIDLPLLQRYNKAVNQNTKFMTEFNNNLGKQSNTTNDQTQSNSLSQLVKNQFTKHNYRNIKIAGKKTEYEHYNPNITNTENKEGEIKKEESFNNILSNINKNKNQNGTRKNVKRVTLSNGIKDILGVIKAKPVGQKKKKKKNNQNNQNKSITKNNEVNEKKRKGILKRGKKKLVRLLSQPNIISNVYQISHKIYFNKEKEIKSLINVPIIVKDIRGKKMRVTLIRKKDKIIPINDEGKEVKNAKILNELYEKIKEKIKSQEEKNLLPKKRLSFNPTKLSINSLKLFEDSDGKSDISKSDSEDLNKKEVNEEEIKKENSDEKRNNSKIKIKSPIKDKKNVLSNISKKPSFHDSPKSKEKKPENQPIDDYNNNIKKVKINDDTSFYKEEDDFVKDFNFEFYSSEDETSTVSLQKLMRQTRKKINKYLFQLFEYISKNAEIERFKKEDLIKFLIDKDFRNNFRLLKEQIIKLRELVRDSLDPEGKDKKKKIYIKDLEIINYIYRYIKDKNSLFYKSIYKRIKKEQEEERKQNKMEGNYNKLIEMLKNSYVEGRKKNNFSLFSQRKREYSEDKTKNKNTTKKFKKRKAHKDLEYISQDEKKLLLLNEINLTNEIRYQISISNDKESKEKFKNLLNKIESLRKLSGDEYVKSLKENFLMFKDEAEEILNAKDIEERLNGFIDDLNFQRNNLKDKHRYIMSSMLIKDNKFLSIFDNEVLD